MAYVTHLKPDGTYQPLKAHEENVAALAGKFAEAFGAKAHGERTGAAARHRQIQRQRAETAARSGTHGQGGSRDGGRAAGMETERLCCGVCPWRAITAVCRIWAAGLMTAAERFGRG